MADTTDRDGNRVDFEAFRKQEILKGKPLTGKGGVKSEGSSTRPTRLRDSIGRCARC